MQIPFQSGRRRPYVAERDRLLAELGKLPADSDEYKDVLTRLNDLDKILTRSTELKKTVIPALGGIAAVGGIYALQQFGGVIIPKALENWDSRRDRKKNSEND